MGYKCVALITAFKIILKGYIFVKTLVGILHSALYKTQSTRSCMKLYLKYHLKTEILFKHNLFLAIINYTFAFRDRIIVIGNQNKL